MTASRLLALFALLALLPPAARCADDLATVSGKVTFDGKPLAGVKVTFHLGGGQFAGATTQADGSYKVERLPPGTHPLTVEKTAKGKMLLPPKYSDEATSALRLEVKKGEQVHDIDLRSR